MRKEPKRFRYGFFDEMIRYSPDPAIALMTPRARASGHGDTVFGDKAKTLRESGGLVVSCHSRVLEFLHVHRALPLVLFLPRVCPIRFYDRICSMIKGTLPCPKPTPMEKHTKKLKKLKNSKNSRPRRLVTWYHFPPKTKKLNLRIRTGPNPRNKIFF